MPTHNTSLFRRWLKRLAAPKTPIRTRNAPRRALAVEALEDRVTPATNLDLIDAFEFTSTTNNNVIVQSTAVDSTGNTYVAGYFAGTADFNPGTGSFNLTSAGGSNDAFVVKLDSSGGFVYAAQFGATSQDQAQGVAVDGSGNAYVTGYFYDTVDFDPGAGTFNLTSAAGPDAFVVKLDSAGALVYADRFGGTSTVVAHGVAVDGSGNAYVTGYFYGTADFDPGAGTTNLASAGGSNDAFVVKLDSSGALSYADRFGGTSSDYGQNIAVDGSGNAYVTGYFYDTADFDPGAGTTNLTSAGNADVFVVKLDATGALVYADRFGGPNSDYGSGVAVDADGNAYVAGYFYSSTVDFDPGAGTFSLTSNYQDSFVVRLDSTGALVEAIKVTNGASSGYTYSYNTRVAADTTGNVYVAGSYTENQPDYDPGTGTTYLSYSYRNYYTGFLAKYGDLTIALSDTATDPDAAETTAPASEDYGTFTLTRSAGNIGRTIYLTTTGTATNGSDYGLSSVTFAAGSATVTATVVPYNDNETEGPETVTAAPDGSGYTATGSATITIADNEPEVTVYYEDRSATETATPTPIDTGSFTFVRTGSTAAALTVFYTMSGTATHGSDYGTLSGSVTIPAGSDRVILTVTPLDDALTEVPEIVAITLTADPTYTLTTYVSADFTIYDNEPTVRLFAADTTAVEGSTSTGRFTVERTGDTTGPLDVQYSISGSATNGTDYAALPGTVTIPAGSTSVDIVIDALTDAVGDADETVILTVEGAAAYNIASPFTGQVVIGEPDAPPAEVPQVTLFAADGLATEGSTDDGRFTVTRTGSTAAPLTVFYSITGGATNSTDYAPLAGSVVILAGQSSADVVIDATDDALDDAGETVVLSLSADAGYAIAGPNSGQVTILEPTAPPPAPPSITPPSTPTPPAPQLASAVGGPNGTFVAYNSDGSERFRPTAYAGFTGRVNVALGDVNGDGVLDVITGTGSTSTHVKVFDGVSGAEIRSFMAFGGYDGGVNVGAGDLAGDGLAEVLVGTATGSSHVKAFSGASGAEVRSFFAFDGYSGGVTVAGGDLDANGLADIVVGTASGVSHVKGFGGPDLALLASFMAGATNGVNVGAGDLDGDGFAEIVTGCATGSDAVGVYRNGAQVAGFSPFGGFPGGVFVGVTDRNRDGDPELIVGAGPGSGPHVKVYSFPELAELASFFAFAPSFSGGVPVASAANVPTST